MINWKIIRLGAKSNKLMVKIRRCKSKGVCMAKSSLREGYLLFILQAPATANFLANLDLVIVAAGCIRYNCIN
jgi:hypothetical protein